MKINERIRELRKQLHLSQEYVAKYLGVPRSTVSQMESGKRKVLAEDVSKLCALFGVSADALINGAELSEPANAFARCFENLNESDQAEIMNMMRFKERMKLQRGGN